jgi:hypothetical protein
MFTDQIVEVGIVVLRHVFVWAGSAEWAVALDVSLACWAVWREAVAIGLEEKGCEGKGVLRSLV